MSSNKHIRRKKPLLSQIDDFFSGIHGSISFQPRHSGHSALEQGRRNRSFSRLRHLRRRPKALLTARRSFISMFVVDWMRPYPQAITFPIIRAFIWRTYATITNNSPVVGLSLENQGSFRVQGACTPERKLGGGLRSGHQVW